MASVEHLARELVERGHPEREAWGHAVLAARRFALQGDAQWFDAFLAWRNSAETFGFNPNPEPQVSNPETYDRQPTWWEQQMSLDKIDQSIGGARDQFQQAAADHVRALASQVASQLAAGKEPQADLADLENELHDQLAALYRTGRHTVQEELTRQLPSSATGQQGFEGLGFNPRFAADGERLPDDLVKRAKLAAEGIFSRIVQTIKRLMLSGRKQPAEIQQAGEEAGTAGLRAEAMVHAAPALNLGRSDEADSHADEIVGSRYTSILDKNRCEQCQKADDDTLRPLTDPVRLHRRPPNPDCYGGDRCRCMEFFQLKDEAAPHFSWDAGLHPRDPGGRFDVKQKAKPDPQKRQTAKKSELRRERAGWKKALEAKAIENATKALAEMNARWPGLIVVEQPLDPMVARGIMELYNKFPPALWDALRAAGFTSLYVGTAPLTDLDDNGDLRGVAPAGDWGSTSWDNIDGVYRADRKSATMRYEPNVAAKQPDYFFTEIFHEIGHAVGDLLGHNEDAELHESWRRLSPRLTPYLRHSSTELLAEGIGDYFEDNANMSKVYDAAFADYIRRVLGL